jgi:hypothetical protein
MTAHFSGKDLILTTLQLLITYPFGIIQFFLLAIMLSIVFFSLKSQQRQLLRISIYLSRYGILVIIMRQSTLVITLGVMKTGSNLSLF